MEDRISDIVERKMLLQAERKGAHGSQIQSVAGGWLRCDAFVRLVLVFTDLTGAAVRVDRQGPCHFYLSHTVPCQALPSPNPKGQNPAAGAGRAAGAGSAAPKL